MLSTFIKLKVSARVKADGKAVCLLPTFKTNKIQTSLHARMCECAHVPNCFLKLFPRNYGLESFGERLGRDTIYCGRDPPPPPPPPLKWGVGRWGETRQKCSKWWWLWCGGGGGGIHSPPTPTKLRKTLNTVSAEVHFILT